MGSKQSAERDGEAVSEQEKNVNPVTNSKNSCTSATQEQKGGRRRSRRKRSMKRRHCSNRHKRSWRHKRSQRRR